MRGSVRLACSQALVLALSLGSAGSLWAVQPKDSPSSLESKEMFVPELYISNQNLALEQALAETKDRGALKLLAARQAGAEATGRDVKVWIDPRGGAAVNVLGSFPLIPGNGVGNRITLGQVSAALGRGVSRVDGKVVADLVRRFAEGHRALLGVDTTQLGEARTGDPNPDLWHVSIPQVYQGIPVRYGRLLATLSHGNMVLLGAENWADVQGVSAVPSISAEKAVDLGFEHAGGRSGLDDLLSEAHLEFVPYAPQELQSGEGYGGPIGQGLRHYLGWVFTYQRRGEDPVYKVTVDAHSGRVLEFKDTNEYVNRQIKGAVYPLTDTEICPTPQTCGQMQAGAPMPFADTGLPAPNNYTNSGGLFDYTSGTVTTTFNGKYVKMSDTCGAMNQGTATPPLDLGGANGDHDCTVPAGASVGNTPASRSGFYELNKLIEMARGYLPSNTWLQGQLTANMNLNNTCNAFWNGTTVNFYKSGGGCRNTGEIAAVFDHEWGHGMDDNDTAGTLSNSSEGYADIAGIYRLQASCVGHGFFQTVNPGCGMTADGTGFNQDEDQTAGQHCDLDCSGVRDADWDKHADHTPDTALGFVCSACNSGSGPCGRQVHCAAAPTRQAAWDLVKRDLQTAPFNLNDQTAFLVGNKLFYQGSGNIGAWHSCTCGGTSDGCAAANGYMQWLAADDDNGNLSDGTPHMTALHAAFDRHGIACATPTPVNSGCAGGPTTASTLTVTPGLFQNALTWTPVAGATRYWVYRGEGYAGCDFGKALIAEVTAPTVNYTDTNVANGLAYSYNVVAAGAASACFGPASNCDTGTPMAGADFSVSCPSPLGTWEGENLATPCDVNSSDGFNASVALSCQGLPAGLSCGFSPASVTPPANGSIQSTLTLTLSPEILRGGYDFQVKGSNAGNERFANVHLDVNGYGTDRHGRYDSGLKVPRCFNVGRACDTGALVNGRDGISGGAEPNQPNTINNSCPDGTSGTYHVDESIDYVRVYTTNGQSFAGGSPVQIDVRAWIADFTQDRVDVYYAPDANSPVWALVGTLTPTTNGLQTLGTTYVLTGSDAAPSAIRAHLRRGGAASSCGAGSFDDHDDLIFALGVGDQTATYDPTLKAPKCGVVGKSCDSDTLLVGRDGKGPEPNQPNTINTSCNDGTSGTFHSDESNDRLKVETLDGTALAAGKTVKITATVWAWSTGTSDHLELFYAPDATAPVWTKIGATLTPAAGGQQVFQVNYTLPSGSLQAIRARFRFSGSDGVCGTGSYDDHDDLIFAVAP